MVLADETPELLVLVIWHLDYSHVSAVTDMALIFRISWGRSASSKGKIFLVLPIKILEFCQGEPKLSRRLSVGESITQTY